MPYPKQKSELYENFGGINEKVSTYLQGKREFEKLVNFDAQKTGALTKTPGVTLYIGATTNGSIYGLCEYSANPFTSVSLSTGQTSFVTGLTAFIATTPNGVFDIKSGAFSSIYTLRTLKGASTFSSSGNFDFQSFSNYIYGTDGLNFFKYNGLSAYSWGVPKPLVEDNGFLGTGSGGISGIIVVDCAFLNNFGLLGPARSTTYTSTGYTSMILNIGTNHTVGISFGLEYFGVTTTAVWVSLNGSESKLITTVPALSGSFLLTAAGFSAGNGTTQPPDYVGAFDAFASNSLLNPALISPGNPKYIALFENQLWFAGFNAQLSNQSLPSTVYYTEVGQSEIVDFENFIEIRTNNNDVVSGLFPYQTELLVFKYRSVHSIRGFDPNFSLVDKSLIYGCLSNRAVTTFRDMCWFLDEKGICQYNGANFQIVSDKMEATFKSMNIAAAKTEAMMIHVKDRFEVWCAIPINGSTTNNCVVVYDYVAQEWYRREGLDCASLLVGFGTLTNPTPFFGTYSGAVKYLSPSVYTDNANGMTCVAKTHWNNDMGNSVDKMWRRLFLDADFDTNQTLPITVNFYTDHSSSIALTETMYMGQTFQNRIDFGLSAKSLSVEFIYNSNNPLRINGWTIEYRFQRAV